MTLARRARGRRSARRARARVLEFIADPAARRPARPAPLLSPVPGYQVVHGHDLGSACNRDCRYELTAWHRAKLFLREKGLAR